MENKNLINGEPPEFGNMAHIQFLKKEASRKALLADKEVEIGELDDYEANEVTRVTYEFSCSLCGNFHEETIDEYESETIECCGITYEMENNRVKIIKID